MDNDYLYNRARITIAWNRDLSGIGTPIKIHVFNQTARQLAPVGRGD